MILAIDIGNTTVGISGVDVTGEKCQLCFARKLETRPVRSAEDYTHEIRRMLEDKNHIPEDFEGIVMSSVVPQVQEGIQEAVRTIFGKEPMLVTCHCDLGITVGVEEPEKIGKDRLVDSAWAAANYPLPVVTADLGTATTFNVIDENRVLMGGVITAGMLTGLHALASRTAQLPALDLKKPDHIIGRNTTECMLTGAVAGTAAILDGIVLDIEEELGRSVSFVITGGGAPYVDTFVRHPHIYEPDMILKGLAYLYKRNS